MLNRSGGVLVVEISNSRADSIEHGEKAPNVVYTCKLQDRDH